MRNTSLIRRVLAFGHLWAGLILGVPLVILGLTGSLLVLEHDIDRWSNPAFYRASEGAARPVSDIVAAALGCTTERMVAGMVILPGEPGEPAIVRLSPPGRGGPGGPGLQVFVDPATLQILGTREPAGGIVRQAFLLHANLMVRGDRTGREIIGWLGVVMLALGLTGLYMWWPRNGRWLQAFTVKRGTGTYRFNRDLHGAVGIWGLVVFIVVSFSGVYLAFPQPVGGAITTILPGRDLRASAGAIKVKPTPGAVAMDVDAAIALARASVPEAETRSVFMANRPDQPYRIGLARPDARDGAPAIQVFVDPFERRVIEVRDPRDFSWGETITAWQHALHEGSGLGLVWKGLVLISGFLPLLFAVTGLTMWLRKRRQRREAGAIRSPVGGESLARGKLNA
jgi:uncharacterized iron-regulated membrane protein